MDRDLEGLVNRTNRVGSASYVTFVPELRSFLEYIQSRSRLRAIAATVRGGAPGLDLGPWSGELTGYHQGLGFPDTEAEFMRLRQHLLERVASDSLDFRVLGRAIFNARDFADACAHIHTALVLPYATFLEERLGTESEILHILARYKVRTEWFTREGLFAAFEADTKKGEAGYDADLRRFLFDQGIDYPFYGPHSPSGKADVVALLDTSDPLVCEVKLYDGTAYNIAYLAKGVKQALRYAKDYAKTSAHLVVFNLTEESLQFPDENPVDKSVPSITVESVRCYLHSIQAKPLPAASRPGSIKVRSVTRADLLSEAGGPA